MKTKDTKAANENITENTKKSPIIETRYIVIISLIFSVIILLLISTMCFYCGNYKDRARRTFIYPLVEVSDSKNDSKNSAKKEKKSFAKTGNYIIETRYIENTYKYRDDVLSPEEKLSILISDYVDELLLGATAERTKYMFTAGTKNLSCFERNEIVYLNLSSDCLKMGDNVIELKKGVELLKENIFKNFSRIKSVEVFIDGRFAYENY
ncbi:MAG: hypothetical protein MJ188_04350 [Treponema sp.]|nr:hypothetical protein [Treponema sp.]